MTHHVLTRTPINYLLRQGIASDAVNVPPKGPVIPNSVAWFLADYVEVLIYAVGKAISDANPDIKRVTEQEIVAALSTIDFEEVGEVVKAKREKCVVGYAEYALEWERRHSQPWE